MLTVEEAQQRVLDEVRVLDDEQVGLIDARNRVLREDVAAPHDLPQGDNSAMDGYALRAEESPGELRVIEDVAAGHTYAAHSICRRGEAGVHLEHCAPKACSIQRGRAVEIPIAPLY